MIAHTHTSSSSMTMIEFGAPRAHSNKSTEAPFVEGMLEERIGMVVFPTLAVYVDWPDGVMGWVGFASWACSGGCKTLTHIFVCLWGYMSGARTKARDMELPKSPCLEHSP